MAARRPELGRIDTLDGIRAEMAQDWAEPARSNDPQGARPLVAFDFDGTLTVRDSFTAFLKWRTPGARYALGGLKLAPAALAYVFHRDRGRIKAAAVREYLKGVPRQRLEADARAFAESHGRQLLRPDAVAAWRRWRSQ